VRLLTPTTAANGDESANERGQTAANDPKPKTGDGKRQTATSRRPTATRSDRKQTSKRAATANKQTSKQAYQ
jgi:hypothetical protein